MKILNKLSILSFFVAILLAVNANCQNASLVDIEFFYSPNDPSFRDLDKLSVLAVRDLKSILSEKYKISIPPKSIENPITTFRDKLNIKYEGKAETFIFGYIELYNENSYNIDLHVYAQDGEKKKDGSIDIKLVGQHFGEQNEYIKNWLDSGERKPEIAKLVKSLASTFDVVFSNDNGDDDDGNGGGEQKKIPWKEIGAIGGGVVLSGTAAFLRFKGKEQYQVYLDDLEQEDITDDLKAARKKNRWAHTTAVIGIAAIATGVCFILNKDDKKKGKQNPVSRIMLSPHIEPYPILNTNSIGGKITYSF